MDEGNKQGGQSGGVNISGGSVHVGGDLVGGDKIADSHNIGAGGDVISADIGGGENIAVGRGAAVNVAPADLLKAFAAWQAQMNADIDARPNLSADDKQHLKSQVGKISAEAGKGAHADPGRLERFINDLGVMAPDILEVALATLANPLAGLGLVAKKIGDRAKLEQSPQRS